MYIFVQITNEAFFIIRNSNYLLIYVSSELHYSISGILILHGIL